MLKSLCFDVAAHLPRSSEVCVSNFVSDLVLTWRVISGHMWGFSRPPAKFQNMFHCKSRNQGSQIHVPGAICRIMLDDILRPPTWHHSLMWLRPTTPDHMAVISTRHCSDHSIARVYCTWPVFVEKLIRPRHNQQPSHNLSLRPPL